MFQWALLTKKPMPPPHARMNQEYGMMLSRSAFAVMLKFSDRGIMMRRVLSEVVGHLEKCELFEPTEAPVAKGKKIHTALVEAKFEDYTTLCKKWEQAT